MIASASNDGTMRLWDITGNLIDMLMLRHSIVNCVAFSPDGQMIVSVQDNASVQLWDLKGNPIGKPFQGDEYFVCSLAFSADGKMIVYVSNDGMVRLWSGGWNAWLEVCCDRLRYHPVFKNPEKGSIEEAACETCKKYV